MGGIKLQVFASLVTAVLVSPAPASPQARDAPQPPDTSVPTTEIPVFHTEILVTPERYPETQNRIPAATFVMARDEIEKHPAETLPELLESLPGMHVLFDQGLGGVPMVSSRGFFGAGEADYVQLLVDGVPVVDVESGVADWGSVQAADIERIEALRGPGSSLYGDTALGGVVQIFTRRSRDRAGRAAFTGGTEGTFLLNGGYRWPIRSLAIDLIGNGSRTSGFRENSRASQGSMHASVTWPSSEPRWALDATGWSRNRREPGALTATELAVKRFGSNQTFRFDRDESDKARVGLTYQRASTSSQYRLRVDGAARHTDLLRTLLIVAGVGDRTSRAISTAAATASAHAGTTVPLVGATELQINSGLEVARERLETDYRSVSSSGQIGQLTGSVDVHRLRTGAFGSIGWTMSSRLRVSAGLRWDHISDRVAGNDQGPVHMAWSPRAGLNVLVGPVERTPVSLFIQATRAFKAATVDQLFDPHPFPDFRGGTFQISSDTLEPQRAVNFETGASQTFTNLRWEIVAYRMTVRNEIDFDPATFRYGNIGRSRHSGLETEWRLFQRRLVSPGLSYTWTHVTPLGGSTRGLQLKNIPVHVVRPDLTLTLPRAARIHVRYTLTAGRYLDDGHQFPLRDGSVVDLRIEKRVARHRVTLDLLNVGGADVEELGFALPGLSGNQVAHYYPGIGFAARAAFSTEF